jgi:hypothetical protein
VLLLCDQRMDADGSGELRAVALDTLRTVASYVEPQRARVDALMRCAPAADPAPGAG